MARGRTGSRVRGHDDDDEISSAASTDTSDVSGAEEEEDEVWAGDISAVIGLQKRGLRGLMEGRRARERSGSVAGGRGEKVGLGIA